MLSITPTILYCDGEGFWDKLVNDSPYEHTKITPDQFMNALNYAHPDIAPEEAKSLIPPSPNINTSVPTNQPFGPTQVAHYVPPTQEEWQSQMGLN